MKSKDYYIYTLLALATTMVAASCVDTFEGDNLSRQSDNIIRFAVSSGFTVSSDKTRSASADNDADLPPVVLIQDSDTLYLHRYVAPESERATGCHTATATSRAAEVNDIANFKSLYGNFYVQATYTDENKTHIPFSEAEPLTNNVNDANTDNDVWYIKTPRYYWPVERALRFNAYAPVSAKELLEGIDLSAETITFDYTVPVSKPGDSQPRTDAEQQPDIMFASTTCDRAAAVDGVYAPLNFRHALSAIKFAVRDIVNGEIIDISIKGVAGSGSCTFNPSAESAPAFTWTNLGENVAEYTQTFNYETVDPYPNIPDLEDATIINNTMPEKTFMLIPQEIPEDAMLEITFNSGGKNKTLSGKLKTADIPRWEAGKEYIYTISTSSENWTYVFEVSGNEAEGYQNIYVYSPYDDKFADFQNTGYYSVTSYRYRTNNPNQKEILPWTATFLGSESYEVQLTGETKYEGKYITAEKWISDQDKEQNPLYKFEDDKNKGQFRGIGSYTAEKRNLNFYPHYTATDWQGDKDMQNTAPFENNTKATPYDLSTFGSGKKADRSTANCYVVDRPGWYCLPLVYGNAIVNGETNSSGYTSTATGNVLKKFYDYKRKEISGAYITTGDNDETATLMWMDAYNLISDVSLRKIKKANGEEETMLCFYVDKDNLQQGNALVALQDKDNIIMWSWHIWITEHWLGSDGKPQILSDKSGDFTAKTNTITGMRERGDATVTKNQEGHTFYMSPYNLGWCDPKNVNILKRKSRMDFVQYMPDKITETKKNKALDIIQQGEDVNYKIGNNTYYQWGRKDPLVGFANRKKNFKTNFGPEGNSFGMEKGNSCKIEYGIKKPNIMLATNSVGTDDNQNWTSDRYMNLWNNSSTIGMGQSATLSEDFWSHVKTVYDPCPVGYIVPNAGIWMVLGCVFENIPWDSSNTSEAKFDESINGKRGKEIDAEPRGIMLYIIYGTGNANESENYIYLIPTGNRWYSDFHNFKLDEESEGSQELIISAGLNYNLRMFYSWSSRMHTKYTGLTGAIGIDGAKNMNYILTPQFNGRGAMGRPIRPIRDPNFQKKNSED